MDINLQQRIVITLGFAFTWGPALAVGVFPFVTRRNLGIWKVSFWTASLVGVIAALGYTVIALSSLTKGDVERLTENVPYLVMGSTVVMLFGFFGTAWSNLWT